MNDELAVHEGGFEERLLDVEFLFEGDGESFVGADGGGEFGEAVDGTTNGFALTSGGSIMMGDYLTIRAKQHTADTGKYPAGGYIDMRTQNKNATLTKSGQPNQTHHLLPATDKKDGASGGFETRRAGLGGNFQWNPLV